ncbi:hypothetical protein ACHQM5_029977 [Ranunculus cassubicifolius]
MVVKRNWSGLPKELLQLIVERIKSIEVYVRFGGVCKAWGSVAVKRPRCTVLREQVPWLMLSKDPYSEEANPDTHSFFRLSDNKVHHLDLPDSKHSQCWGSPYGWLVIRRNEQMRLLNPLSKVSVALPPLSSLDDYYPGLSMHKVVLTISTTPTSLTTRLEDKFVVLIIFVGNHGIAFARPGDRAWGTVELNPKGVCMLQIINLDILYSNNRFYITTWNGEINCFDISSANPVLMDFSYYVANALNKHFYLVDISGEVHLVERILKTRKRLPLYSPLEMKPFNCTHRFRVHKLNLSTRKLEELDTLGDYAVFLGNNTSFSLLVSDNSGCKRNSIYFTDDHDMEDRRAGPGGVQGLDMGIYSFETGEVEPLYTCYDFQTRVHFLCAYISRPV